MGGARRGKKVKEPNDEGVKESCHAAFVVREARCVNPNQLHSGQS